MYSYKDYKKEEAADRKRAKERPKIFKFLEKELKKISSFKKCLSYVETFCFKENLLSWRQGITKKENWYVSISEAKNKKEIIPLLKQINRYWNKGGK